MTTLPLAALFMRFFGSAGRARFGSGMTCNPFIARERKAIKKVSRTLPMGTLESVLRLKLLYSYVF